VRTLLILCIFFISCTAASAQSIIGILENYVLINTDTGIGKISDEVNVQRRVDGNLITVGRIKLSKFKSARATGKIVEEFDPYKIKAGDFLEVPKSEELIEPAPQPVQPEKVTPHFINLVESGFVFINTVFEVADLEKMFTVSRTNNLDTTDVGVVKIFRLRNSGTIAQIIQEYEHYKIQKDDFLTHTLSQEKIIHSDATGDTSVVNQVVKIQGEYILFNVDSAVGEIGETVFIQRQSEKGTQNVSVARLMEFRGKRAIAQVVESRNPFQVEIGDYVTNNLKHPQYAETDPDIDYYFFRSYRSKIK
jgi:hypothetical protein